MSRLVFVARAVLTVALVALPTGLAAVGPPAPGHHRGWLSAGYWMAVLTVLLFADSLAARATRWEATVAGAAALGILGWSDPVLAVVLGVPLLIGAAASRWAVSVRSTGMAAVVAVRDRVSTGTAQLVSVAGCDERATQNHRATVDCFHDVFDARTRRIRAPAALAEAAYSPVVSLAVILTAATTLGSTRADVLIFVLLGPVAGGCVRTLTRPQSPAVPSPVRAGARVKVRTTVRRLLAAVSHRGTPQAAAAAISAALLHGIGLGLTIAVISSLSDQHGLPWWSPYVLLGVAVTYAVALVWAHTSAHVAGVAILRQLSYQLIGRILSASKESLTAYEGQLPRMATHDVVTISGIPVHSLRSLVAAGLPPVSAIATMMTTARWLAVPILILSPLPLLLGCSLLRKPYRGLRSTLVAAGQVLDFLEMPDSRPPHRKLKIE